MQALCCVVIAQVATSRPCVGTLWTTPPPCSSWARNLSSVSQRAEVSRGVETSGRTVDGRLMGLTDDWLSRQVASWACSLAVGTTERPEDPYPALQGELCDLVQILDFSVRCFICTASEEAGKTSLCSEVCFCQWPAVHSWCLRSLRISPSRSFP